MRKIYIVRKTIYLFVILPFLFSQPLQSQNSPKFGTEWGGIIWTESFYDTRETVSARDGDVFLYPEKVILDQNNLDINANAGFNMVNVHSRAQLKVTTPDFVGAKVSGLFEMDFVGSSNDKIGLVRLRHAMIRLNWEKSELLIGQFWHPLFDLETFPRVISPAISVPFHPLSRNAQMSLKYEIAQGLSISGTILTQLDFKSTGPDGPSSKYMRDSGFPEVNGSISYKIGEWGYVGSTIGYKTLKPQLSVLENGVLMKCTETIGSYHFGFSSRISTSILTIRMGTVYGENMYNFLMMGGYAISGKNDLGEPKYSNLLSNSYWLDIETPYIKEMIKVGVFGGYAKNLGSNESVTGSVYGRGTDIDYTFRVSPRIVYGNGALKFRLESNYDIAAYGITNNFIQVGQTTIANNIRILFSTTLEF